MEKIIKTLLLEGIDEATIHRVLDILEDNSKVVDIRVQRAKHKLNSIANIINRKMQSGELNSLRYRNGHPIGDASKIKELEDLKHQSIQAARELHDLQNKSN